MKLYFFDTYLQMIRNAPGSALFRNSYAEINGKKADILWGGVRSCAFFASSILVLSKLLKEIHVTVDGTVTDMKNYGWTRIRKPKKGCVLVWDKIPLGRNGTLFPHIGFYVGEQKAISNRESKRSPAMHHWTFGTKSGKPRRAIAAMYWNKKLTRR